MSEFSEGDVVMLRSGGPRMTVMQQSVRPGCVTCAWFDNLDCAHLEDFAAEGLINLSHMEQGR